jgi:hypothetical protein
MFVSRHFDNGFEIVEQHLDNADFYLVFIAANPNGSKEPESQIRDYLALLRKQQVSARQILIIITCIDRLHSKFGGQNKEFLDNIFDFMLNEEPEIELVITSLLARNPDIDDNFEEIRNFLLEHSDN